MNKRGPYCPRCGTEQGDSEIERRSEGGERWWRARPGGRCEPGTPAGKKKKIVMMKLARARGARRSRPSPGLPNPPLRIREEASGIIGSVTGLPPRNVPKAALPRMSGTYTRECLQPSLTLFDESEDGPDRRRARTRTAPSRRSVRRAGIVRRQG